MASVIVTPPSGISVEFRGGGRSQIAPDGSLLIEASPLHDALIVESYTPAWDGSRNGAVLNPGGAMPAAGYGLDARMGGLRRTAVPVAMMPGDALVIARSAPPSAPQVDWPTPLASATSRSVVEAMQLVMAVPYDPTAADLFRPTAIGRSQLACALRATHCSRRSVRVDNLPRLVRLDALPPIALAPHRDALAAFQGELFSGWSTDIATPGLQHLGYGSWLAACVSEIAVLLCSTLRTADKLDLAHLVVQAGIDLIGAFADDRQQSANGGHCGGRKALVMLAGILTGTPAATPDRFLGAGSPFVERWRYKMAPWWFNGTPAGAPWHAAWAFADAAAFSSSRSNGSMVALPPSQWGDPEDPQHQTWAWCVKHYMGQVVGADVGTGLAMRLLGRGADWSAAGTAFLEQWFQGPGPGVRAALEQAGIVVPWGTSYGVTAPPDWCAAAWRQVVG